MPRGNISLNAKGYVTVPRKAGGLEVDVEEYTVSPYGEVIRTEGATQLSDLKNRDAKVWTNLTYGHGKNRIRAEESQNIESYKRFWDANGVDTRWEGNIQLGSKFIDSSEPTNAEVIRASCEYKGELWSVWDRDDTGDLGVYASSYEGATPGWNTPNIVYDANAVETVALDVIAHKTHMICLFATSNDHITRRSTDGATWSAPAVDVTLNLLSNVVTQNEDTPFGRLAEIGGELVAILFHESNGTITFFSSTDAGDNWADEAIDISSASGPFGVAVYQGVDNLDKLYVLVAEGLYEVDTSTATWTYTKVLSDSKSRFGIASQGQFSQCLAAHTDGKLWAAMGASAGGCPISTLDNSGGIRVINNNLGFDFADGLPTGMDGQIRWLLSSGQFLYAAMGGDYAPYYGRIMCHNGKGWHTMYKNATAQQDMEWLAVSSRDDKASRLHWSEREFGYTSVVDTVHIPAPNYNPQVLATTTFNSSGTIDLPYIDGGMPTFNKTWIQYRVDADDLGTTSQEKITVKYGTNGAVRTTTTLGEFISGTTELTVASGAGVAAKNIGTELVFAQRSGGTTQTAKMRSLELVYLPQPDVLEGYIFTVDLAATANLRQTKPEVILAELKTARDLTTLPILVYGNSGSRYVKVRTVRHLYALKQGSGSGAMAAADAVSQRHGYAEIVCEEVI